MPELPEVETIKNTVKPILQGATLKKVLVRQRKFREDIPDDMAEKIEGAKVVDLKRIAKYLLISLNNNLTLIWHFGMSGKFKITQEIPENFDKHDHVILITDKGVIIYNDTRRFGLITYCESSKLKKHHLLAKLGLDPWDEKLTPNYLLQKFAKKKTPIKLALLDQEIICGIGNIYASEILYKARIRPERTSESITEDEAGRIITFTQDILKQSIKAGGSTIHDFRRPDGDTGYFQNQLCVYGKDGLCCPDCTCHGKNKIKKTVMGGRSTFFCEVLQK